MEYITINYNNNNTSNKNIKYGINLYTTLQTCIHVNLCYKTYIKYNEAFSCKLKIVIMFNRVNSFG